MIEACSPGGASTLTSVTELQAAAGPHAAIAPAKFVDGSKSVFAFEHRFVDGKPVQTVIIDSKQSTINRGEKAVSLAISDGHPELSRLPRIEVSYSNGQTFSDLDLPHRFSDGHIRAGSIDGEPTTSNETYRAVRNSTQDDASAILNTAPAALVFGGWDSTRKNAQLRLRSALVGEIIGVLSNQELSGSQQQSARGGARIDPVAASINLEADSYERILQTQSDELSPKSLEKQRATIKKLKKGDATSSSPLGLGAIPPSLESPGSISCSRIIRSWVLSFATLRQLRFASSPEGNIAARALLAAFGLATMARAEQELYLRANCDLVESAAPVVRLDQRHGQFMELDPIRVEDADALFSEALEYAAGLGVAKWDGQVFPVVGNPDIIGGATEEDEV